MNSFDKGRSAPPSAPNGAPGASGSTSRASDPGQSAVGGAPQRLPFKSLIVVIPASYTITPERIAERIPSGAQGEIDVIVACAGQPAVLTGIHTHLRNAQFLLAPVGTSVEDLRVLAFAQAAGDIVSLVSGTPAGGESEAPPGGRTPTPVSYPLSIVVPVCDGSALLEETLTSIVASSLPRKTYELIVVDDGSRDDSATIAARYADTVVRLEGPPRGRAYARNRGIEQARGDIVGFVDSGVRIRRDTLARLLAKLEEDPTVAAVGASNDGTSGDGGVATQYWNLIQQYGAQKHGGVGAQFAAGCGVVRRTSLVATGMFDEWLFSGASIEDLDLGSRLNAAGHRVLLSTDVAVSYLGKYGVRGVLRAAWKRSTILMRSVSYRGTRPLARGHVIHMVSGPAGFGWLLALGLVAAGAITERRPLALAGAAVAALSFAGSLGLHRFFLSRRSLPFALSAAPLHAVTQMIAALGLMRGWLLRTLIGDPAPDATTQAFAEVGMQLWPPIPKRPPR